MSTYRCYFLDRYSLGNAFHFEAGTDIEAAAAAEILIERHGGQLGAFEVWEGARLVCEIRRSPSARRGVPMAVPRL